MTLMFRWAAAEGLVSPAVPQLLSLIPSLLQGRTSDRETGPLLPADDELVDSGLPHLPEVVADVVRLQSLTGARPSETCEITPGDVDGSKDVWEYKPKSHKTEHNGHSRAIFIGSKTQEILLRYLVRDPAMYCGHTCDSEEQRRAELSANQQTHSTWMARHTT